MIAEKIFEKGWVPDPFVRFKIRSLLKERLDQQRTAHSDEFFRKISEGPIAVATQSANEQHYEVPAAFFEKVLGPRMKYSCAFFERNDDSLEKAEERMLALTCERAQLEDGQTILELGCGWGSLTLWMAERYPKSQILGVSNSRSQRDFILGRVRSRGIQNVTILTRDMNDFDTDLKFDRVVSVEMFEHMRNVGLLFKKISNWLKPEGKLFVHIFSHREYAYFFEDETDSDWMARHFFTGGMMPSHDLYKKIQSPLSIEQEWVVSGTHYAQTSERWLENMDAHENEIQAIFREVYGRGSEVKWWSRWRAFFMACAELWAFQRGSEWQVSHYRFQKRSMT